jgi:cyclophilin family peptidyl-prolyl cis-trans isomerase
MKKSFAFMAVLIMLSVSCSAMSTPPANEKAGKEGEKMNNNPKVLMETSKGNITIELYPDKAPITVGNFLSYVDSKFYDGTIFHRVIPGFMIQGGGFQKGMVEKLVLPPIKNEAGNGLSNSKGTIAMARTNVVDSATAQFFINVADNTFLDHRDNTQQGYGYCVFGKVTEGMSAVDAIKAGPTHTVGYFEDVPVDDVVILSVKKL